LSTDIDNTNEGVRLAKRVAETVPCSRAEAERYIAGGWVTVDGAVAEDPATRVRPDQDVALLPGATAIEPLPVTILLHKPAGLDLDAALALVEAATLAGPGSFLRRHLKNLAPTLPLEREASGMLVFTQDWRVARRLGQDADRLEQEYVAEVAGAVSDEALQGLNGPLTFEGRIRPPMKVSRQSEARLRLAGKNMRPGQVHALCAAAGLTVTGLRRLRIGRVALGALPAGRWRYLHEAERF
jgi:23S rRNA pseudouridine2604 synthase